MAIVLTSVDIIDTGFLSVSNRTSQVATALRVNAGVALKLKGVELEIGSSSNLDEETYTAEYDDIEVPVCSVNPDTIRLTIILNKTSTESNPGVWNTSDMKYLAEIFRLPKTVGFKALYYPVIRGATILHHTDQQILNYLGRYDTTETQGDVSLTVVNGSGNSTTTGDLTDVVYIPVRFKSCNVTQTPDGFIQVTLDGVRTA